MQTSREQLKLVPLEGTRQNMRDSSVYRKIFLQVNSKQQKRCHYFGRTTFRNSFTGIINFTHRSSVSLFSVKKNCNEHPKESTVTLLRFEICAFRKLFEM